MRESVVDLLAQIGETAQAGLVVVALTIRVRGRVVVAARVYRGVACGHRLQGGARRAHH